MEIAYRNFYRSLYMRTGGFIPTKPLNQNIYPGDFFQVKNGEIIVMGNIFQKGIIHRDHVRLGYAIKQNPASWNFSDAVIKSISARGTGDSAKGGDFEYSKQIISFNEKGSFFFKCHDPESVKITNWSEIQQQLIIKLTQVVYSFRELYLVTESVAPQNWTLAISSTKKGELEIASDSEHHGPVDIFGQHAVRIIQSRELEYYHRETNRKPVFFKAKKLAVQEEKTEVFISELITERLGSSEWAGNFFDYEFYHDQVYTPHTPQGAQIGLLDMLSANELNPNTALLFFKWADASLDDIEKLFISYGN